MEGGLTATPVKSAFLYAACEWPSKGCLVLYKLTRVNKNEGQSIKRTATPTDRFTFNIFASTSRIRAGDHQGKNQSRLRGSQSAG
jgi:hypothetical protein